MSSYKGYVPWKTNLSSYLTSKTSPSGSRYSSRDEMMGTSTDPKQMPRFGSITSPSTYRPSYSGGTYRSVGIKREPPITPSYTGRWSTSNKDIATKETPTTRKSTTKSSPTIESISDNKSTSNGHISTVNKPKLKEQTSSSVRPTITIAKARIRDQNSSTSSYSSSKSRDPSPSEPIKDRYTSSSGYVSSSYSKLYPRSSNKLQINNFRNIGTSNPAISYLNGSEMSVRVRKTVEKQQKDKQKEKSPKSSSESSPSKEISNIVSIIPNADDSAPTPVSKSTEEMVEITVVTRGTSPNLCSTTNFSRCRRTEVAKTIERVVLRPKCKIAGDDKEVQSDRMDDTSKYCRFNATRSSTPWPSYLESKYNPVSYTRYSNGATPTKYSPLNKSDKSSNESSPEKVMEKSPSKSRESSVQKSSSVSRSGSFKSSSKSEKSKSKSPPVSPQKSTSTSPSKQRSLSNKSLPPPAPKTETTPAKASPEPKSGDELKTDRNGKWANKDFRKSALNVGPSDRPRKSRNASVDSDQNSRSDDQQQNQSSLNRTERSPSTSSEASHSSSNTDEVTKNLLKLKISSNTQKPNEMMHLNATDSMVNEIKMAKVNASSSASIVSQNEKLQQQQQQQPSQIPKIDNTKSPSVVARSLDAVVKIFKSAKSDRLIEAQNVSDNDSAFSINESTEQDTLIEPMLNRTTTITNLSKTVNSNSYLADESSWINSIPNEQTNTDTPLRPINYPNKTNMKIQLRHIDSVDQLPWWITDTENDDTVADDITLNQSDHEITFNNNNNNYNNTDEIDTSQTEQSIPWWMSGDNNNRNEEQKYRITHIKSGERAWWLDDDTEESVNDILEAAETSNNNINNNDNNNNDNNNNDNYNNNNVAGSRYTFKIKKIESGERAWWLCEDTHDSTNVDNNNENDLLTSNNDDGEDIDFWASINESLEIDKNNKSRRSNAHSHSTNGHYDMNANYIPLGDRASPEGLEDMNEAKENRLSPYDNVGATKLEQNFSKLFISRHENIDDVLGGPMHALSPIFFDGKSDSFVEIQPSQVRIHDGTAQTSHIQYMDGDRDNRDVKNVQSGHLLDDATIQVYKDGDYGSYLDLESSLAEQSEEIEGLHSNSRKNSLVVRTQLSVRVHAIIEKLLTSEGRELRRALFSLKQIFQDDKDLVHGFVALGGLNSLVRVGNNADQNYQNYILRALGQVMLYVDGMNGVMRHSPTIQWLYSLISSKFRLVVKTALKLLLVFVEYVESNCYLLVNAIHVVDSAQNALPWSNIMNLLKDYDNADTELLIYATTLINKTLSGLSDQDSFYDESDFLEQQGMESAIQKYMSRPGTDLDLLDQLQLYDTVLRFEDGETDGIRISDNSVRRTPRCRSLNANGNELERRKSRRHSTGTSPNSTMANTKCFSPRLSMTVHQTLDEDSSSSANSGELNDVFGVSKGPHESAGVTPGLRRRRERAERQKSFLREQQEATTAAVRPFDIKDEIHNNHDSESDEKRLLLQIKRDHTVKDLTQKLSSLPINLQEEIKSQNRIGDMSGLISKAKEGLAKSKSKGDISRSPSKDQEIKKPEPKKSENELHWEELVKNMTRPLTLCDLDFTDLRSDDDKDDLMPRTAGAIPPPPPMGIIPPPMMRPIQSNLDAMNQRHINGSKAPLAPSNNNTIKKNKKTVKLFWKEVREDLIPASVAKTIWDELQPTTIDTQKLEHLFESRAKDMMTKKQQELNKNKEIIVLDHKRSNAINIAMTKLPPPRAIKAAILKMDATVVTREGIDKLLNMLPTEEERGKIQEAQLVNPELPLGSAEQFLLTLSSISELSARLKLWAFKLDFECSEKEIAEPLMDLKQGLDALRNNKTFKCILSTLLSIGIFLNGAPVKGFQIEYLAKVPEVKDTVHKHSLLHHLCHIVMETTPDTTDLYSEIGPVTRASKADFADLAHNINYLESECKASWDRLKLIAKHDCPPQLKQKMVDFLADCAERIIILQIVHRRVINRYRKFLLWLGVPQHRIMESRPNEVCRIVSEFALEYRTTRERVHQQFEKKANHRERNKTRGKMIIDVAKFRSHEDRADAELKQLLGSQSPSVDKIDNPCQYIFRRRRADMMPRSPALKMTEDSFTDGDDELLESLVKTATSTPRTAPRERKRTRNADRKSFKRSRTREGFTVDRTAASPEM